jgi:hypothetical protein
MFDPRQYVLGGLVLGVEFLLAELLDEVVVEWLELASAELLTDCEKKFFVGWEHYGILCGWVIRIEDNSWWVGNDGGDRRIKKELDIE